MGFDYWRFMSSPTRTVTAVRRRPTDKQRQRADTRVPWFVSAAFFTGLARVVVGTLGLLAITLGFGDPSPVWFWVLIIVHGAAMIAVLILVLNGFGWARAVFLVLSLAQMAFDQTLITRYFVAVDVALAVVFFIRPSQRYFDACATVRAK